MLLPGFTAKGKGKTAGQQVPEGRTASVRIFCHPGCLMPEEIVSAESQIHSHPQFGIKTISGSDRPACVSRWNSNLGPRCLDLGRGFHAAHFHLHTFSSIHSARICVFQFVFFLQDRARFHRDQPSGGEHNRGGILAKREVSTGRVRMSKGT